MSRQLKVLFKITGMIFLFVSCNDPVITKEMPVLHSSDWMRQVLIQVNSEAALIDITIPQSHDAGTYVLNNCVGGNSCNTQTQYLDMISQLEAGIRSFDIRPVWINGAFYTQHVTSCGGLGCQGDLMENILSQTRDFVDAHAELVILKFGHFCNTGHNDSAFVNLVNNQLGERIFKEITPDTVPFIHRPLKNIIPPAAGTGKVLTLYDGVPNTSEKRAQGMFSNSTLPSAGGWSNKKVFEQLKEDQLRRYNEFSNDGSRLFEFSWTLTQDDSLAINCVLVPSAAVSIHDLAEEANSHLHECMDSLIASGEIRKGRIPNIISADFVAEFVTEECFKITWLNCR